MKTLQLVFGLLFCVITQIMAQDTVIPGYRISGHYFTKDLSVQQVFKVSKSIMALKDKDGNGVLHVLVDDDFVIPEQFKKYEIPLEKVRNVDELEESAKTFSKMRELTQSGGTHRIVVGKALPGDFSEQDLSGKVWTKDSFQNCVTVINIWYSGCGPCRKEMPILSDWKEKYPGVLFLSANFEKADKVKQITEKEKFNWNHIYNDVYFTKLVGSGGYPLTIVLDKDGIVRYYKNGTNDAIRNEILQVIEGLNK